MTLPLIAALARMGRGARQEVERFFASPEPTDDGIRRVIALSEEHGGIEYARAKAEEFGERATDALTELPDNEPTRALGAAVAYVVERRR
jgi:octaprenyl-diphosphate synthase